MQFDQPWWLWLLLPAAAYVLWVGRQSLSGLGTTARRVALAVRLVVVLLLVSVLARPHWRREAKDVTVTVITDRSESVPSELQDAAKRFIQSAAPKARPDDRLGQISVARSALVNMLPARASDRPETEVIGATDGTNLAKAVNLALAVAPGETANRLVVLSDGNETAGDLMSAAQSARARGVPIDVVALPYRYENEVVMERLVAPGAARMGQNINLRVMLSAQRPARGRLVVTINGDVVDLDPESEQTGVEVALDAGMNVLAVPINLPQAGPQRFEAVFTPDEQGSDAIEANNRSLAVTFVQAEGRVLVVTEDPKEVTALLRVLQESKLAAEVVDPGGAPRELVAWAPYDAVVLANLPAWTLTQQQQEDLRAYVHDLGGGLLMTGGDQAFGAGGWLGSPTADALPLKLDPPEKRQMPRGALVIVMHSCEMPQGNYWGKKVAEAAINTLSRLDLAGITEYSFAKGDWWVHPLSEVGNKAAIMRAVNSLTYGDAQTFDGMLTLAYEALRKANAGARHMVIISDGDPTLSDRTLLSKCKKARITISTVLVYPHNRQASGGPDWQLMRDVAQQTDGKFYPVIDEGEFAKLPEIFIKEAQVVKRSLLAEGPVQPGVVNSVAEPMRGIRSVPGISGYVVTADREGLSVVTLRAGKENDPVMAHWQHGLGKSIAFTSDLGPRWAATWPEWSQFRGFWEQHLRWMMRPSGNAEMRVVTEDLGDRTRVIVEALDQNGDRLNFVRFVSRVVGPDGAPQDLELRQVGPGRYEGVFDSDRSGSYIANLRYVAPDLSGGGGERKIEGNLQTAVSRPFADEYRALRDNSALLKLVADLTGGRVHELRNGAGGADANLWTRDGLTMPVATRPIWLATAIAAIGLFLLDVGVRRVRIDPAAIMAYFRRGVGRAASAGAGQIGSLQQARERAKAGLDVRAGGLTAEQRAAMQQQARADRATAGAKFEATAAEMATARAGKTEAGVVGGAAGPGAAKAELKVKGGREQQPDGADSGEGGLARLKKAREKARDEMKEQ